MCVVCHWGSAEIGALADRTQLMRHIATTHQGTFLVEGKSTDTVGEFKGAEIGASHMLSWKAKKLGKLTQEKVLLEL